MAESYIQHNRNVPTGRAAFVDFFPRMRKPAPIENGKIAEHRDPAVKP